MSAIVIPLVLATSNRHKIEEIGARLKKDWPGPIYSLRDFPGLELPPETGATIEDNARLKASVIARQVPHWVLADDTGLEVSALGGRPGIYSSRFAGPDATYAQNNALLLSEMKELKGDARASCFRSVLVLARGSSRQEYCFVGLCQGIILESGRGENGFGYDPLFLYPPLNQTLAEMRLEEKNRISHRGKAVGQLLDFIKNNRKLIY